MNNAATAEIAQLATAVTQEALTLFNRYGILLGELSSDLEQSAADERAKGNDSVAEGREAQAYALNEFVRVMLAAEKNGATQGLPRGLYTVERHGNGWAIYTGRDAHHHGAHWGQLSECNEALAKAVERGLNAIAVEDAGGTVPDCGACAGSGGKPDEPCEHCDGTGIEDRLLPAFPIRNRYGSICEMAYLLRLVRRGDALPQQLVAAVGRQFDAAMAAAQPARPSDVHAQASSDAVRSLLKQALQAVELGDKAGLSMDIEKLKKQIRDLASQPVHYGVAAVLGGLRTRLENALAESVANSNSMSHLGFQEQAADHRARARALEGAVGWLDEAVTQSRNLQVSTTPPRGEGPMLITLCGSARFEALLKAWNEALTMCGHTVFTLTAFPSDKGAKNWYDEDVKREMDAAHLRKIEASDAIFVINRFAYIGESTMREIEHARRLGKPVYFTESWGEGLGICGMHEEQVRSQCEAFGLGRSSFSPIDTTTRKAGNRSIWGGTLLSHPLRLRAIELVEVAQAVWPDEEAGRMAHPLNTRIPL